MAKKFDFMKWQRLKFISVFHCNNTEEPLSIQSSDITKPFHNKIILMDQLFKFF